MGDRLSIVAGAGSNDTRHAVHLTERCTAARRRRHPLGHPVLQQPEPRAGSCATTRRSRRPPTSRSCSTTSPAAPGIEHAARPAGRAGPDRAHRRRQAGQRRRARSRSTASTSTPATTARWPARSTWAAPAAILVASHVVGDEMRRMVDEPEQPRRDRRFAAGRLRHALHHRQPDLHEGRAEHARASRVGGLRLPLVEATEDEARRGSRHARAPRAARGRRHVSNGEAACPPARRAGGDRQEHDRRRVRRRDRRSSTSGCASRRPT